MEKLTTKTNPDCTLNPEECRIVRKVLQAANLLFTVIDTDYHENKIDALIRKLREYEPE